MTGRYWCAIGVLVGAATLIVWAPAEPIIAPVVEGTPRPPRLTDATAPRELCRLPVVTLAGNGFVTYPGGVYTPDPSEKPVLPSPNQSGMPSNYGYTYDAVYSRWLPVMPNLVSPDRTHYVFTDSNANLSTVDVRT